jgi:trehalose 6-phosphate phosphatase
MTHDSLHGLLHPVLSRRPLGLAFDIDGTLSPIAPTPCEARLYPGVADLLEQARDHDGVHVAIMTGRGIEDGAAMVGVEGLTYIGTHGLEWSDGLPSQHPIQLAPGAQDYIAPGKALLDLVEQRLDELPGVIVQRKRVGGSLHYRLSPHPEETREALLALLEEPARQVHMSLSEGKLVVEVRPPLAIDKGTALRAFAERFDVKGLLFAGDDRTDLDAVREIARMRSAGLNALAVVARHHDTLQDLISNADIVVEGVPGVAELLRQIVKML